MQRADTPYHCTLFLLSQYVSNTKGMTHSKG